MKWLLHLYPPAWRRRYHREVERHLEPEVPSLRTALDLMAGAVDAWLNPKWIPEAHNEGEERVLITASRVCSTEFSKQDAQRSAGVMLGVTLALTAVGVALDKTVGEHIAIEALLYSAFFIALTVSSRRTFLRPYSPAARTAILWAGSAGWYLFFLGVAALAAAV